MLTKEEKEILESNDFAKARKYGITSIVFGILGFFFIVFAPILAIVFGNLGLDKTHNDLKLIKLNRTGIILGYVAIGLMIVATLLITFLDYYMRQL